MTDTVRTPAVAARIEELFLAVHELRRIHPDNRTDADRRNHVEFIRELEPLLALPPAGYALPKAATRLIDHAKANGWKPYVQWFCQADDGPWVTVQVSRLLAPAEAAHRRSNRWTYSISWHSRYCAPGRVRLFGRVLARTPDHPVTHYVPSLKAVRAVITANPTAP
ncbi:hypothetical protein [Kitasatospora sp. NPDC058478]|uniref:hypothetical protein n=1 Tax=unclassified Kitasatospora TaxID=2633591 RepID=UPI00365230CA